MIIVRQVGQYLTFHVRVPEQFLFKFHTTGLCATGCPTLQTIDYRELLSYTDNELARLYPGRTKMSRREAREKCVDSNVAGFYLDSCLFDLLTTGDQNFIASAWHALDDSFRLDSTGTFKDLQTYNTTEPIDLGGENSQGGGVDKKGKNSSSNKTVQPFTILWTLAFLFIFLR